MNSKLKDAQQPAVSPLRDRPNRYDDRMDTAVPGAQTRLQLGADETLVFFGDSITEQAMWTKQVEEELRARFPDKRLRFVNAGLGGDTATASASRFDADVAAVEPTVVFLAFGMNDGGYGPLDVGRQNAYARGLEKLLARCQTLGARAVVLSPSGIDPRVRPDLRGYLHSLERLSMTAAEAARQHGALFVDVFPRWCAEQKRQHDADRRATLAPDGVHPNEAGHRVIAAAVLELFR